MFSLALARRPAGSGRGGPVPFRHLWPALLEELSRAHRAHAAAHAGDARTYGAPAASRDVAASRAGAEGVSP